MKSRTAICQQQHNSKVVWRYPIAGCRHPYGIVFIVSLALLVGCNTGDRNEIARVRGTVTLDGKPYSKGGSVFFQPKSGGKMATAEIQADGSFELTTYSSGDGASVGPNLVMIMPPVAPVDELTEGVAPAAAPAPFPKKYEAVSTSGLMCDVKAGEVNEFPIALETK
jgi:hypothetical protein